jgi:A/G-specific adenine glycosylase
VKKICAAHKKNDELRYPVRSREERYEKLRMAALVLQNEKNEVWLEKQPEQGRWGGLWMFPFWKSKKTMLEEINPLGLNLRFYLTVPHAFTKYRIQLEVYSAAFQKRHAMKARSGRWFSVEKLARTACPAPHRKIIRSLAAHENR